LAYKIQTPENYAEINTTNSVVFLMLSFKGLTLQVCNGADVKVLNKRIGTLIWIITCVKSEFAESVRDCGKNLFFILFKEIAGE
jgi:hypothetical protein